MTRGRDVQDHADRLHKLQDSGNGSVERNTTADHCCMAVGWTVRRGVVVTVSKTFPPSPRPSTI